MKPSSIKSNVLMGIGVMVAIAAAAMGFEAFYIVKYAKLAGVSYSNTLISVAVASVLILIAMFMLVTAVVKKLTSHVRTIKEYSDLLAKGDTNFEVVPVAEDEFIEVYKSLNEILVMYKERAELCEAIAKGDLTVECTQHSANDLMGQSFKHLIKGNNDVLSNIKESSYQLTTGAEQVAAASQALAQGSTEQASAIEQVTVSMKEIEKMTQTNADNANRANDIVLSTKAGAETGNERMEQMKTAMDEINASSEKISKIIKVIDDISFQTNILALNAAVEAARAGNHGKGFAVVAEQIRELAGKSAAAAAETAEMIDDSIRKVHNGTKLADDTAAALSNIMQDIESVVEITGSINKASNEQATAVAQIDQAIIQVSQVVQNNSATSEECAAAAEELSGQSNSLRLMIGKYKLGDSDREDAFSDYESSHVSMPSFSGSIDLGSSSSFDEDPESIISLDGGFGKY